MEQNKVIYKQKLCNIQGNFSNKMSMLQRVIRRAHIYTKLRICTEKKKPFRHLKLHKQEQNQKGKTIKEFQVAK